MKDTANLTVAGAAIAGIGAGIMQSAIPGAYGVICMTVIACVSLGGRYAVRIAELWGAK
ncbi:MAG TPA: hypothetical protein VMY40_14930 [Anaerolineae bacterium]|nr:hypothetical protein [Anaerolineae bacterium]